MASKKIFLLAGEASGDALGGKLMGAINALVPGEVAFTGVGGTRMQAQGLTSFFPMSALSLVGFVEIIPHIPKLLGLINKTVREIQTTEPDLVITIDAPAFNKKVVKKLRAQGYTGKIVHYVAPSVWAYKAKRAITMAELFDHIFCLLPFEPKYFTDAGMEATYVGHPVVEEPLQNGDADAFKEKFKLDPDKPTIAILPGSRKGEIKRLLPIFIKTIKPLREQIRDLNIIAISDANHGFAIQQALDELIGLKSAVTIDPADKAGALAASDIALVKSGTSTLEVAMSGTPMVVTYKVNPLSAYMLRKMIKVDYVTLINIMQKEEVIPELLQERCTPGNLALKIEKLMRDYMAKDIQVEKSHEVLKQLGLNHMPFPSQRAAMKVLDMIELIYTEVEEKELEPTPKESTELATMDEFNQSSTNFVDLPDVNDLPDGIDINGPEGDGTVLEGGIIAPDKDD
jgi:lipid-A-disaccharide synthase